MILGTAGHIDHGKTALVKALTGVDTDRLPEEQRRGITIELGFAPLVLPGGDTIGVVDVPGHEAFVRTMLAGASGIDLALLVVAADEGVMPQTREHLAILHLLGIRGGVIALTKTDLVDADWLALVRDDVASAVAGSPLERATQVPVSVVTGEGLEALRQAVEAAVPRATGRAADDLFRLPVDRSFSVRGAGTVVTGTVWSGQLRKDDIVRVLPGGETARVRGLQSHGRAVDCGEPGSRLAVSLGGMDVAQIPRGSTLVTEETWEPVDVLRADIAWLTDAPAVGPRTRVRFHLGTRDVSARVVAADPAPPRDRRSGLARDAAGDAARPRLLPVHAARVVLDEPIVARGGDRFVLRSGSPAATIGGGVVTDAQPGHRRLRPWSIADQPAIARVVAMVRDAGGRGVPLRALPVRAGIRPADVASTVASTTGDAEVIDGVMYDRVAIGQLEQRVRDLVSAHHARAPLEEGLSLQSLRAGVAADPALADRLIGRLTRSGAVQVERGLVRRTGWTVTLSATQRVTLEAMAASIRAAGREPPSVAELASAAPGERQDTLAGLLRVLERRGTVRQVEGDRYYATDAISELIQALRTGMAPGREYTPSELRELLGVSRKYLIPLLEYFDRTGVTERRASGRVVAGQGAALARTVG